MRMRFQILFLLSLVFPVFSLERVLYRPQSVEYVQTNARIQIEISKIARTSRFKKLEGFYDPRIGMVFIAEFPGYVEEKESAEISEKERVERRRDRLEERMKKISLLMKMRNHLKENERIFFGVHSKDGFLLEVYKKEALDRMEFGAYAQKKNEEHVFFALHNGKSPVHGEYPEWEKLWKVHTILKSKLEAMKFASVSGMFVPGIGNIFICKTRKISLKKISKFEEKYSTKLKNLQGVGTFMVEYFYGGDNYELSRLIRLSDGSLHSLEYKGLEIFN